MAYNERLGIIKPTLSDILSGRISPLDLVQLELSDRLRLQARDERVGSAVTYVSGWITEPPTETLTPNLRNLREDLPGSLFVCSIKLLGQRQLLNGFLSEADERPVDDKEKLRPASMARREMQEMIETYLFRFQGADPEEKYEALESLFYEAACLLLNIRELWHVPIVRVRSVLSGILAERKVLASLREGGFGDARYGDFEEDVYRLGDIVLDAAEFDMPVDLTIQTKGISDRLAQFKIMKRRKTGGIIVEVPMHRSLDQFDLPVNNSGQLVHYVKERISGLQKANRMWQKAST